MLKISLTIILILLALGSFPAGAPVRSQSAPLKGVPSPKTTELMSASRLIMITLS